MELVYAWIEKYKNIKNQEFNFSSKVSCSYSNIENILTIDKKNNFDMFKDSNVSFSLIVGKNGVGKSNLTQFFSQIQNYTHNDESKNQEEYEKLFPLYNYIVVFIDGPYIWVFRPGLRKIVNHTDYELMYDRSIYYHTEFNFGFYNTSRFDTYNIKESLSYLYHTIPDGINHEYFINAVIKSNKNKVLKNIFRQENAKIDNLSIYYEFSISQVNIFFSWIRDYVDRYIDSGRKYIHDKDLNYRYEIKKIVNYLETHCNFSEDLILLTKEQKSILIKIMINGGFDRFEFNTNDGYNQVIAIILRDKSYNLTSKKFFNMIEKNSCLSVSDDEYESVYTLSLNIKNIAIWNKYKAEIGVLLNEEIFKSNLIIKIKNKLIELNQMSSGEQSILLVKLVINNMLFDYKNEKNNKNGLVIFLDEPETYLHPELQKNLINDLYEIFKDLEYKIHIVITSHSPFLLSDIPKNNIVFLDTYKEKSPEVKSSIRTIGDCKNISNDIKINSFGANIHTLLSHGFFMKDGLMGKFAKEKISDVIKFLNKDIEKENYDYTDILLKNNNYTLEVRKMYVKEIILNIGEEFLKEKLLDMYYKKFIRDDLEKEKEKLLEKQKHIAEQIENIEKKQDDRT